jgi:phosphate transport system protein
MKRFDNDVASLQSRLSEMGDLAKSMVVLATAAIKDRTRDVHGELYECEKTINKMQTDIDQDAIRMLTIYGPVAKDLRFLLVCTHVTAKLERIGDLAVNICQALELMTTDPADRPLRAGVRKMADTTCEIVDDALDAYFSKNQEKAIVTRRRDDIVDAMNDQVMKEFLTNEVLREVLSGAADIGEAVAQILISRYLERIADQATNICKEVVYMVKGDDVRHVRNNAADDG